MYMNKEIEIGKKWFYRVRSKPFFIAVIRGTEELRFLLQKVEKDS